MDWRENALCKDLHIDFFYPPIESKDPTTYYRIAKDVCSSCKVWDYCLDEAIANREVWGCWGGLTPQERLNPGRAPHGTRERFRMGCSCDNCFKASEVSVPVDTRKIPVNGQPYDLQHVSNSLHWD